MMKGSSGMSVSKATSYLDRKGYSVITDMAGWFAAKAEAGTRIVNVSVIGTSITEGYNSSDVYTLSYVSLLREHFKTLYGDVGSGLISDFWPSTAPRFTYAGGTWSVGGYGVGSNGRYTSAANATATITFEGDGVEIWVMKAAGCGTFNAAIDGGDPTQFNAYNATSVKYFHFDVTGLADAEHTLVLTNVSAALYLVGIVPLRGSAGIRVHNCGKSGATAAHHCGVSSMPAAISDLAPDLTIIELGTNDFNTHVAVATFKTNMQTMITSAKTFGDVLLLTMPRNIAATTPAQIEYITAIRELARENSVRLLDLYAEWGGPVAAEAAGYIDSSDHTHLEDAGHQSVADLLIATLT